MNYILQIISKCGQGTYLGQGGLDGVENFEKFCGCQKWMLPFSEHMTIYGLCFEANRVRGRRAGNFISRGQNETVCNFIAEHASRNRPAFITPLFKTEEALKERRTCFLSHFWASSAKCEKNCAVPSGTRDRMSRRTRRV